MQKFIKTPISPALVPSIAARLTTAINDFKPYSIALSNEERIGKRSMAEGREGLVRLVSRIALQHSGSLSKMDDPQELLAALEIDTQLELLRQACMQLLEMISDTQFGNSCDIMVLADNYVGALQFARGRDAALDSAMAEVDEWNKRYRASQSAQTPDAP